MRGSAPVTGSTRAHCLASAMMTAYWLRCSEVEASANQRSARAVCVGSGFRVRVRRYRCTLVTCVPHPGFGTHGLLTHAGSTRAQPRAGWVRLGRTRALRARVGSGHGADPRRVRDISRSVPPRHHAGRGARAGRVGSGRPGAARASSLSHRSSTTLVDKRLVGKNDKKLSRPSPGRPPSAAFGSRGRRCVAC